MSLWISCYYKYDNNHLTSIGFFCVMHRMYQRNAFVIYFVTKAWSIWSSLSITIFSTLEPHLTASQRPSSLLSSTSTYLLPKNSNKTSTTHPSPTSLLTGKCLNTHYLFAHSWLEYIYLHTSHWFLTEFLYSMNSRFHQRICNPGSASGFSNLISHFDFCQK